VTTPAERADRALAGAEIGRPDEMRPNEVILDDVRPETARPDEVRPEHTRPTFLTVLTLAGATAGWGVGSTMTRLAVQDLAPLTAACIRFGLGALLLLAILAWRGETSGLPARRDWLPLLVLGLLGVTTFGALFTAGLQWTGAAEGTLIQGLSPLLTLLLAALLVGEPVRRGQVLGGLTAFAGLAVLLVGGTAAWGGGPDRLFGNLVLVAGCLCWTAYNVAVRLTAGRLGLAESTAYALLVGTALLVPFALAEPVRVPLASISLTTWLAIGYLAVVSTCLAYIWWNDGIRKIGAGRAAMFSFVGPVAAMLSAVPILDEWPGPSQLLGGILILAGLFVANGARPSSPPETASSTPPA
jgi:drug/metabolite transporter (DMT)-like permease